MKPKMNFDICAVVYMLIITTLKAEEQCIGDGDSSCACNTNINGKTIAFRLTDKQ